MSTAAEQHERPAQGAGRRRALVAVAVAVCAGVAVVVTVGLRSQGRGFHGSGSQRATSPRTRVSLPPATRAGRGSSDTSATGSPAGASGAFRVPGHLVLPASIGSLALNRAETREDAGT
jgi:hypothetical protein